MQRRSFIGKLVGAAVAISAAGRLALEPEKQYKFTFDQQKIDKLVEQIHIHHYHQIYASMANKIITACNEYEKQQQNPPN